MTTNVDKFFFGAEALRSILGVDAGFLQQWLARGVLPSETVSVGRRRWHRFSSTELPRLLLTAALWADRLPISEALALANRILAGLPGAQYVLCFVSEKTEIYLDSIGSAAEALRIHGPSAILVSLEEINQKAEKAARLARAFASGEKR